MKNRREGRIPSIIQILKAAVGQQLTASEVQAAYNEMHYGDDFAVNRETILSALVGYIRRHPDGPIYQKNDTFFYTLSPMPKRTLEYAQRVNARRREREAVEAVNHPRHYGGEDNPYEAIKVIEAWELGFNLGNTVKYIARAGQKGSAIVDLEKAAWYLNREIARRQNADTNRLEAEPGDSTGGAD